MAEGESNYNILLIILAQHKQITTLVNKIISVDGNEDALNEFQKHMKYNITLINYLRVIQYSYI